MTRLCLDTSAYSHFMRGQGPVVDILDAATWIGVPAVVLGELRAGFALGSQGSENERELKRFLGNPVVTTLDLDDPASVVYAEILRGWQWAGESTNLVTYPPDEVGPDPNAPRLYSVFQDDHWPVPFLDVYQIQDWNWECNCPGEYLTDPYPVTMVGFPLQANHWTFPASPHCDPCCEQVSSNSAASVLLSTQGFKCSLNTQHLRW